MEAPENRIHFAYIDINFRLRNIRKTKVWLNRVALKYNRKIDHLACYFLKDKQLLEMNQKYLSHNTFTDILTFDYSESRRAAISAEIYISVDRVRENANLYDSSFSDELHRVMAHGLLHVLGFGDKTKAEQARMRSAEEIALHLLNRNTKKP